MIQTKTTIISLLLTFFYGCSGNFIADQQENALDEGTAEEESNPFVFNIENLTDTAYPDNPDLGFRSKNYQNNLLTKGYLTDLDSVFTFKLTFLAGNDTVNIPKTNLSEFIPTIPSYLKGNEYLSHLALINQEWNRNQVQFSPREFQSTHSSIIRVDVARNCLNAYLWEVILYTKENGKTVPYSHGWFEFPHHLYAQLFEQKNGVPFDQYKSALENWIDPPSELIDQVSLRKVIDTVPVDFVDLSDQMYPIAGARMKKRREIIYPEAFSSMRSLQTDSTLFATFSPPGFYNKEDPRKTELGRIHHLLDLNLLKTSSSTTSAIQHEITIHFKHQNNAAVTRLVLGGLDLNSVPILPPSEANKGWKNSMGFGNHTFYERYPDHLAYKSENTPYYAYLINGDGKWLDSHKIGIDGPILHFSDSAKTKLHLWLLSFERHAFVGHYLINIE